jgi:hypothetical protein
VWSPCEPNPADQPEGGDSRRPRPPSRAALQPRAARRGRALGCRLPRPGPGRGVVVPVHPGGVAGSRSKVSGSARTMQCSMSGPGRAPARCAARTRAPRRHRPRRLPGRPGHRPRASEGGGGDRRRPGTHPRGRSAGLDPRRRHACWHDRAAFHFLTAATDRARYRAAAANTIVTGGCLVVGTFADDGPTGCPGLATALRTRWAGGRPGARVRRASDPPRAPPHPGRDRAALHLAGHAPNRTTHTRVTIPRAPPARGLTRYPAHGPGQARVERPPCFLGLGGGSLPRWR